MPARSSRAWRSAGTRASVRAGRQLTHDIQPPARRYPGASGPKHLDGSMMGDYGFGEQKGHPGVQAVHAHISTWGGEMTGLISVRLSRLRPCAPVSARP